MKTIKIDKDEHNQSRIVNWDISLIDRYIIIKNEEHGINMLGRIKNKYEFITLFSFKHNKTLYELPSYFNCGEEVILLSDDDVKVMKI